VFSCDATLVKTDAYGNLSVEIAGNDVNDQATLSDVDLHVYVSNEKGDPGEVLAEDTSPDATEAVTIEDVPAGYYLVYADWYLGVGSIDGTATLLEPTTPTDTPPVFTPAEPPVTTSPPARQQTFADTQSPEFTWSGGPGAGLSDAHGSTGCRVVNCDFTLFKAEQAGALTTSISTATPTLVDADIHLYASDANGAVGEEIGTATAFSPNETVTVDVTPGYYLMRVDFSGAGTYDGRASLGPLPVETE
jgi:hypothetical protein